MDEQTHEPSPKRSMLERLITALAMRGATPLRIGSGGLPEMTSSDWAGALSGSGDPIGEEVVWVRYLGRDPTRLVRALHLYGWHRLGEKSGHFRVSSDEHRGLAAIAVAQHAGWQRMTREEVMHRLRMGRTRYDELRPHHVDLVTRLANGESVAMSHLRRRVW